MATFSITIDDKILDEVAKETREGETRSQTIERMLVTSVGRLAASRKWAKTHTKAPAKKKAVKKAKAPAKKKAVKKAKAPKVEATTPTEQPTLL